MKYIKPIVGVFAAAITVAGLMQDRIFAQTRKIEEGLNEIGAGDAPALELTLGTIVDIFLFLIGAVAVVMLVYGGFRYATSAGDTSAVSSAKNTILYAVVGIVIAVSAYAISDFVIDTFSGSNAAEDGQQSEDDDGGSERPGANPTPD